MTYERALQLAIECVEESNHTARNKGEIVEKLKKLRQNELELMQYVSTPKFLVCR